MSSAAPTPFRTLFQHEGTALPGHSKSVQVFPFEVPEGTTALEFRFDYAPRLSEDVSVNAPLIENALTAHNRTSRFSEDMLAQQRRSLGVEGLRRKLNNLINAVLIDPSGVWRGRWDRNPASEHEALRVGTHSASKGFLAGPISSGRWTVAVECHGVYGAPVQFQVSVGASSQPSSRTAGESEASPTENRKTGPGWYFGEMHSHTLHSDGVHELLDLTTKAQALGLDWLALTDHNTTSGLFNTGSLPLTLLPGCELTTFHGHHPVYGLTDIVPWHQEGRVRPLSELAPVIRRKGGIVSVAHPFRVGDPICTGCRMPEDLSPGDFDLFEVWYRRWNAPESDNRRAYAYWNELWEKGHHVTAVAARDWHGPSQEGPFPGPMAFTGIWAQDGSAQSLLEGLRKGAVIMSGGPVLTVRAHSGSTSASIGDRVPYDAPADVEVEVSRLADPAELRLMQNGQMQQTVKLSADGSVFFRQAVTEPGWYRAELWAGELPLALTNHVVFQSRAAL